MRPLRVARVRAVRVISLIIISLIRFQGLDLKKKSPINDQKLCVLSSDSHGKLRFRQGLDRKSGNLIKEIGRRGAGFLKKSTGAHGIKRLYTKTQLPTVLEIPRSIQRLDIYIYM